MFWEHITALGGWSVTGSVALAIGLWLALGHCWRVALYWCVCFALGLLLVLETKLAFVGWGMGIRSLDFAGFSGHAVRAAAVFPIASFLLLKKSPRPLLVAGVVLGMAAAALVAYSRVRLHAHSISEAAFGFALGTAIAMLLVARAERAQQFTLHPALAAVSVLVFILVPQDTVPSQPVIEALALKLSGNPRPYDRRTWQMAAPRRQPGCPSGQTRRGSTCV